MHTCFYNVATLKIYIKYIYVFCFLAKKCHFLMRIRYAYLIYIFNVVTFLKIGVYVHMYLYSRALLTQNPKEENTLS